MKPPSFKKGDLVRMVSEDEPTWTMGRLDGYRWLTTEEVNRDIDSGRYQGMNEAGETKLVCRTTVVKLKPDENYLVLKGRSAWRGEWGNPVPHCAVVFDHETGHRVWIRKFGWKVVS